MIFLLLLLLVLSYEVTAYSMGAASCTDSPGHGGVISTPGVFSLELLAQDSSPVTGWVAGSTYTIKITSPSQSNFRGFNMGPFSPSYTSFSDARLGTLTAGTNSQANSGCSNVLTQTSGADKTFITGSWTAPAAGTGSVKFVARVVVTKDDMQHPLVTLTVPEGCDAGKYWTGTTCSTCLAGTYSTAGSTSCSDCPAGTYGSTQGLTSATCTGPVTACSIGFYAKSGATANTNSAACLACPTGYSTTAIGGSTQCLTCAAGYSGSSVAYVGSTPGGCTICGTGTYKAAAGLTTCTNCPAGTFGSTQGLTSATCTGSVTTCEIGNYAKAGATANTNADACLACPTGYTTTAIGGPTQCGTCTAGYSGSSITFSGSTHSGCTICAAGTFAAAGQSICTNCPSNIYTTGSATGQTTVTSCTICAPGYAGTVTNPGTMSAAGCSICAAGTYAAAGQSSCTPCAGGTFSSSSGQSSCSGTYTCNAGQKAIAGASSLSNGCADCLPGTYQSSSSHILTTCTDCVAGSYTTTTGQSSCTLCAAGKYGTPTGQSTEAAACPSSCPAGTSSPAGSDAANDCTSCTSGTYSTGGTACLTLTVSICPAGKFAKAGATADTVVDACTACPAGTSKSSAGNTASCTSCTAGSTYQSVTGQTSCISCSSCGSFPGSGIISTTCTLTSDTVCSSPTPTTSATVTSSKSPMPSLSPSSSGTVTLSSSVTVTPSDTVTVTSSATASSSATTSSSNSATASPTITASASTVATITVSSSPSTTSSDPPKAFPTLSPSPTTTPSATSTRSSSLSKSASSSGTISSSAIPSLSPSSSATVSLSSSVTVTPSDTVTVTSSATASSSATTSSSNSATASPTITASASTVATITVSSSPSTTSSDPPRAFPTLSPSPTTTPSVTSTRSSSSSGSASSSATVSGAILCPPGKYLSELYICKDCEPGTYQPNNAYTGSSCTLCPANTFGNSSGLQTSSCSGQCPFNTLSPPGSSSCSNCTCTLDSYSLTGNGTAYGTSCEFGCVRCAYGSYSNPSRTGCTMPTVSASATPSSSSSATASSSATVSSSGSASALPSSTTNPFISTMCLGQWGEFQGDVQLTCHGTNGLTSPTSYPSAFPAIGNASIMPPCFVQRNVFNDLNDFNCSSTELYSSSYYYFGECMYSYSSGSSSVYSRSGCNSSTFGGIYYFSTPTCDPNSLIVFSPNILSNDCLNGTTDTYVQGLRPHITSGAEISWFSSNSTSCSADSVTSQLAMNSESLILSIICKGRESYGCSSTGIPIIVKTTFSEDNCSGSIISSVNMSSSSMVTLPITSVSPSSSPSASSSATQSPTAIIASSRATSSTIPSSSTTPSASSSSTVSPVPSMTPSMSGSPSTSSSPTPSSFSCPLRTYWNGTSCNACLQVQYWNGTACLSCPLGYYGNGTFCDSCSAGEFLNITSSSSSLDSICQPCPVGSISFPSSTSCTCLTCGDTQAVLDTVLKKNINITSIDSAVDVLSQINLIVDDLSIILSNNSIGSGNSGSSGGGGTGTSSNKTVSNANATAFRSGIITLIGTITNVFTSTADIYVSLRTILTSTNTSFLNSSLSSSTSSNSSTSTTSILANDTSILIPEAVSDVLASNLVTLTSNPAQLTQNSASSALESLSDLLTLNLPVNVLSGAVDTIFGGERNVSNVAPFTTKSATTFLTAINNVLNKFQEDVLPVQVDTTTSASKENSTNTSDALPLTPLQSIDNTLNILTAVVLRSSNVDSTPISVVSAPSTATFNASVNSTTYLSSYCGSALSLTAMRISVPNSTTSSSFLQSPALNIPLQTPLRPCLETGKVVAKEQALTPAVSANADFLRTVKTLSTSSFGSGGGGSSGGGGGLIKTVDASLVQYGQSPVPESIGWSVMGGKSTKIIDSTSLLDTRVISFKLLSQSGQKLDVRDAASPMTLLLPLKNPLVTSTSSSIVSSYNRLSFNITCPGMFGLQVDDKKTNALEFLHVLKSSATSFTSTSTATSKAITSLSIVSRNIVTGQAVVSVPCGGPIGIRNITCKGGNSSYILIYDCPSISLQPICAFWNETLNAWSSSGCFLAKYDRESISCSCNHTTNFAARFVALADMQEDLFSTESLAALAKPEELLRLYPHVFIIIGIITAFVLLSSIITYDLDVRASRLFYETLRTDPEIKFLERIETLKGNVFFLDRVMDDTIYANQDKISRARLQRQAKEIADRNGWHYTGYREVLPSGIDINKFDWTPKKLPTYLISNLFCCCGRRSLNYEVAAEKRLQAPVMQSNPMQRMNRALPVVPREDEKTSTITSVTISSSSLSSGEGGGGRGGGSPSTKTGWLKRLTHDYTRAIYSRVKGAFDNFKVSANSNFTLFSKAAGIPSSIVEAVDVTSKENESFEDLLEPGKQENIEELLQEIQAASTWTRFIKLRGFLMRTWVLYVLFNHPYFSIFTKYDPRNPRYLRMLKLSILLIGNLWTTTFLFSFVNEGGGVRTIPETILVALLSCLLQVPISMITAIFIRNASVAEFDSRYPYIAAELRRRARVEDFLGKMSKKLLEAELKNVASDDFKHFTHSQIMSSLEGVGLPTLSNDIDKTVATMSTATTVMKKKVLVKKMMKKKKSTLSGNIPASDSSPMNSSHRALHNHDPDHETSDDDFDQKIMSHSRRMLVRDLNDDDDDDDFDKEIHDHTSQHHHHKHNHEHQQRDHHHQGRHQHHHHSDHHLTRKSHFGPIMKNQAKHGAVDDDDDDNNDEFGNSTNGKNDDTSSRNKDNDLKDSEDVHLAVASDFEVATKIEADEEEEEEEEVEVEEEIEVPSEHVDPNKDLKHEDDFSYGWINAPQDLQQHCPWMLWCCGRHPSQRDAYIAKMKKLEEDQRALLEKKKKEAEEKRRNNLLKKKKRKTFFGRKGKEKKETVKENAVEEHAAHHHHHDEKNSTGNAGSVISQDAALAGRNAATTAVGVGALSQSSSSSSSTGQSRDDHDQDHDHDLDHGRVIKDDLGDYNGSGTDTGDESLSYLLWFFSPIVAFCCKSTRRVQRVQTVESFESIIQKSRRNLSTAKNSNSSSDGSLNDEGGKSNKVETQDTILRQAHSRFSSVSILPCTVSMLIAITISCLVLGFQIFYISLFGFRNDDKVTLSLTITWALSQGWSLFVVEPGMSFVDLIITFVIRPAWLPYFLWIPYVGPIVAGKVASDMVSQDGKTILSGRMQNLTLVRAAGAASQLSPELAVVAYGFGAVISATLSNVEDKLLILSTKKKKKKKTTSTSATKSSTLEGGGDDNDDDEEDHHHHHHYDHHRHLAHKLSQRQRHELIVHRYILAQLHSVEEAQRNRNVLAEKLAKAASVKGWRRIGRTTKTMHDPTILQLHHEHHQSELSTK